MLLIIIRNTKDIKSRKQVHGLVLYHVEPSYRDLSGIMVNGEIVGGSRVGTALVV